MTAQLVRHRQFTRISSWGIMAPDVHEDLISCPAKGTGYSAWVSEVSQMIRKEFVETADGVVARTTFVLPEDIWASAIYLVGDFNGWRQDGQPMVQDHQGRWIATIDLEPDRSYRFRYLCDGEWMNDNQADGYVANPHGTHDSVVMTHRPTGSDSPRAS